MTNLRCSILRGTLCLRELTLAISLVYTVVGALGAHSVRVASYSWIYVMIMRTDWAWMVMHMLMMVMRGGSLHSSLHSALLCCEQMLPQAWYRSAYFPFLAGWS